MQVELKYNGPSNNAVPSGQLTQPSLKVSLQRLGHKWVSHTVHLGQKTTTMLSPVPKSHLPEFSRAEVWLPKLVLRKTKGIHPTRRMSYTSLVLESSQSLDFLMKKKNHKYVIIRLTEDSGSESSSSSFLASTTA